jgi:hypothetical protein
MSMSLINSNNFDMHVLEIKSAFQKIIEGHQRVFKKFPSYEYVNKKFISFEPKFSNDHNFLMVSPCIYRILFFEFAIEEENTK